jgi:two-component system sensor histidine kinase KdpD
LKGFVALTSQRPAWRHFGPALLALAVITLAYRQWLHVTNATIVALTYLLVVLLVATSSHLWVAVLTSCLAMAAFNFFFLPPVGTLTIADPQNWVALIAFLTVSLVASRLSALAQDRQREASARRDELARLFDLSRDVLLSTDSQEALPLLARFIARRFELDYAAVCLPFGTSWNIFHAGSVELELDESQLTLVFDSAQKSLEFDAQTRTYTGHRTVVIGDREVRLVPLRLGTKPLGLLAAAGRTVEAGTLDALAGVVAIAIERAKFLEERKGAELARQSEELKSALLASLAHDLRTPLTAIRVAASNLQGTWLTDDQRREQAELVLAEVERLTRLFQNILEMARIDAGAILAEEQWVYPSEIVEAAEALVEHALRGHPIEVQTEGEDLVRLDPRLTASALAHLLENAAQYSSPAAPITVRCQMVSGELSISVRDRGAGVSVADLPNLFARFYRGSRSKGHVSGTGMGLSIARGLLAAEHGRVSAENCADGGALFTIMVPVENKASAAEGVAT